MGESRIPRLSIDEAKTAASEAGIPEALAELSVFRMLLKNPPLAKALNDMLFALLFRGTLDARLRELVIMRIGWRTAAVYEWTQHWHVALRLDVSEADLLAVREGPGAERFGPAERAVLAATDETLDTGTISNATWGACEEHVGDEKALLELVCAIGNWRLFSSLLKSLEVPLEEGTDPWPPDGQAPR